MRKQCVFFTLQLTVCAMRAQTIDTVMLGTHPWAARQPTAVGRAISCLYAFRGLLYAGYGDYNSNTGPIVIAPFDPAARTFDSVFTANTEAIYNYREIFGRLFAPATDRRSYSEPGDYFAMDSAFHWHAYNAGNTTHAFDMATLNGTDLWIVGAQGDAAVAFRSTDAGSSWDGATLGNPATGYDTAVTGTDTAFARYYFAAIYRGKLFVQALDVRYRDLHIALHPFSRAFNGSQWNTGPNLFAADSQSEGWRPIEFHGELVFRRWEAGDNAFYPLRTFDTINGGRTIGSKCVDFTVDGDTLFSVVDSAGIFILERTQDLVKWQILGIVPNTVRSIARMNGNTYLGTSDSRIIEAIVSPSAIAESAKISTEGWGVFPNPALHCAVTIAFGSPVPPGSRYCIRNVLGRECAAGILPRGGMNISIPASRLLPGAYDVEIFFGKIFSSRRMMVTQ